MATYGGLAVSRGLVSGPVYLYCAELSESPVPEYVVSPDKTDAELVRFRQALDTTCAQLARLVDNLHAKLGGGNVSSVFDGHIMLLQDKAIIDKAESYITVQHLNAEAAVRRNADRLRKIFESLKDPYMRERALDVTDIEERLLRNLAGIVLPFENIASPCIIVAQDLTPSETVLLPQEFVLGIATDAGSATSHVALLARSLGIPAVAGLGDITRRVSPGENILLDGTNGAVTVNPDRETENEFRIHAARERELVRFIEIDGRLPGALKDGYKITFLANVQPGVRASDIKNFAASGVGLYRSEYLWLAKNGRPSEEEQYKAYRDIAESLGPESSVVIRLFDIGGDKTVHDAEIEEKNPFLGNRSIRYLLSHRDILREQLRAILRASVLKNVSVMYPMVAVVEEVREVNAELSSEMAKLRVEGIPFDENLKHGVMIELPSAAINAAAFAKEADFFSIGTNDLVQYTLAADRSNDSVNYLYQPTNPAVLKLVQMTVEGAATASIPVAVCGESASDPVLALLWVGLGVTELSMSASYIPLVKKVLREFTLEEAKELVAGVFKMSQTATASAIYSYCRDCILSKVPDLADIQSFFLKTTDL